ncbi:MAG: helix-turn-helix domain-containing protein [Gammaproteobacteria bacterium]|nr:helix-turn-helix domain-containing protein [Gammaproteobacteria bacterium]
MDATATAVPTAVPTYLDKTEVAAVLGVSVRTLLYWIKQDRFPPGRRLAGQRLVRWDPQTVQDWFDSQPSA